MSYDIKKDTITVEDVTYDVVREPDRASPEETLTLRTFDMEQDEFVPAFEGLSATLGYEEYIEEWMSPRDASNVGTMSVHYRGYTLGDEDIGLIDFEVECPKCEGHGELDVDESVMMPPDCDKCGATGYLTLNPIDYFKQECGARVVIGLTVYEHSGITMRAGDVTLPWDTDRWDTSFVGFIYDTPEGVKQCIGDNATDEQIEEALRDEVKLYASYLEGDVTWYTVSDEETGFEESCGGYVGSSEECEKECFSALEAAIIKRLAEIKERDEWNARDVPTM